MEVLHSCIQPRRLWTWIYGTTTRTSYKTLRESNDRGRAQPWLFPHPAPGEHPDSQSNGPTRVDNISWKFRVIRLSRQKIQRNSRIDSLRIIFFPRKLKSIGNRRWYIRMPCGTNRLRKCSQNACWLIGAEPPTQGTLELYSGTFMNKKKGTEHPRDHGCKTFISMM